MNKYVKVKGHSNWFLQIDETDNIDPDFDANMKEKLIRKHVSTIHNEGKTQDFVTRLIHLGINDMNYLKLAKKYGTILVRPSGTFMLLRGSELIEEKYSDSFPVTEYGDVVICENDSSSESFWMDFLRKKFPDKKIVTINFFDLRTDSEISDYFEKAEIVSFSTTFSNLEWFKKLRKNIKDNNKVIGYSHDVAKWDIVDTTGLNIEKIKDIK
jgi:hypothetical protein